MRLVLSPSGLAQGAAGSASVSLCRDKETSTVFPVGIQIWSSNIRPAIVKVIRCQKTLYITRCNYKIFVEHDVRHITEDKPPTYEECAQLLDFYFGYYRYHELNSTGRMLKAEPFFPKPVCKLFVSNVETAYAHIELYTENVFIDATGFVEHPNLDSTKCDLAMKYWTGRDKNIYLNIPSWQDLGKIIHNSCPTRYGDLVCGTTELHRDQVLEVRSYSIPIVESSMLLNQMESDVVYRCEAQKIYKTANDILFSMEPFTAEQDNITVMP